MKDPDRFQTVGNITGIAVAKEQHASLLLGRDKPTGECNTIFGLQLHLLKIKPDLVRGHFYRTHRKIDKAGLRQENQYNHYSISSDQGQYNT